MTLKICLSFDLEEFDIPLEYGQTVSDEEQLEVSAKGTRIVLDLLKKHNAAATFFITGYFAEQQSDLVKEIAASHEVASHGLRHSDFDVSHLRKSREILSKVSGQPITGFRRARLADTPIAALKEAGYQYDSSENPIWLPGRYCHITKPRRPYSVDGILRIPVSASPLIRFPLFWLSFRNVPFWLYKAFCAWTLKTDKAVFLYCHPWEFCDISKYGLPSCVHRRCGKSMIERFAQLLEWASRRGDFTTYADQVELHTDNRV